MRYAGAFSEYNYVRSTERKEVSISPVCVFSIKPPIKIRLNSMSNNDCRPLKCGASIFLFCSRKHQKHTIIPTRLCIFSVNAPPPPIPIRAQPNFLVSDPAKEPIWESTLGSLTPGSLSLVEEEKANTLREGHPRHPGRETEATQKKTKHTNFNVSARSLCLIIYGLG